MEIFITIVFMIYKVAYRTLADTFMYFVPPFINEYLLLFLIGIFIGLIWACICIFRREDEADVYDFGEPLPKKPPHPSGDN